jgi:hypothetical protein
MSFLLKWLRPQTSARIRLRPHRTVEVAAGFDEAYDRVLDAMRVRLGANVSVDDRAGRFIEAGFGLVNSERLRASFELPEAARTIVRLEAVFAANVVIPERSAALDALADAIEAGVTP